MPAHCPRQRWVAGWEPVLASEASLESFYSVSSHLILYQSCLWMKSKLIFNVHFLGVVKKNIPKGWRVLLCWNVQSVRPAVGWLVPPAPLWGVSLPAKKQLYHPTTSTAPPVLLTSFGPVSFCDAFSGYCQGIPRWFDCETSWYLVTTFAVSSGVDLIYLIWLLCHPRPVVTSDL